MDLNQFTVADFQLGFDHSIYEIGEDHDGVSNEVYIEKLNENVLQQSYNFTIHVIHNTGSYSAVLGKYISSISIT